MPQPNVVFLLIDDLGARDLGCFGSTFYETPNLDHLAAQGMLFNRAYASCPVSSPTRASIMSGKYPARVGVTQWIGGHCCGRLQDVPYLHYLPREETSVATALREGGYQTWHVGKWHLGDEPFWPEKHGFDVNLGGSHWSHPLRGYFSPWGMPNLSDGPQGQYLTDRLTDDAITLVRQRDRRRPFFLNFWHYAVHNPTQAPEFLVEKYRAKVKMLGLDKIEPFIDRGPLPMYMPPGQPERRYGLRVIQSHSVYAAMMENLDSNIGRLLSVLEEECLAKDTLVIFTSDNGGLATAEGAPTCNLPLAEGKGWNQEGGVRVCQIARWPGVIRPASVCDANVTSTDFYPTLLEAAGLPLRPEQICDGVSLMPLLNATGQLTDRPLFWHYPHYSNQGGTPAASVLEGDWKLIQWFEDNRVQLYHLPSDPSEVRNLAASRPDIARRLLEMLTAWQGDVCARIPEPNPDYERLRPAVPNDAHM